MRIKEWQTEDRPYEKLLTQGAKKLTDVELLAIFIKSGTNGKTAVDIAQELLFQHGSLQTILSMPKKIITRTPGIGNIKYLTLLAAAELGRRSIQRELLRGEKIDTIQKAQQFLMLKLKDHLSEVFACIFLKNNLDLISFDELFFGTINETNIYPREIVRRCISHNAAKIILAHNHPSGDALPSYADKAATHNIFRALELIDVEVIDHIIIGQQKNFSFKDRGLL